MFMGSNNSPAIHQGKKEAYVIHRDYQGYDVADGRLYKPSEIVSSPIKSGIKDKDSYFLPQNTRIDETPTKTLPRKRKSLLREMKWEDNTSLEQQTMKTKHPMEMRSRKRSKLTPYYDYQEYSDFAEDLSFLFDEQLPDLEFRPRRTKHRKRKSMMSTKKGSSHVRTEKNRIVSPTATSPSKQSSDANEATSLSDDFSTTRPNLKATNIYMNNDLTIRNNPKTSEAVITGTCPTKSPSSKDDLVIDNCAVFSTGEKTGPESTKPLKKRKNLREEAYGSLFCNKRRKYSKEGCQNQKKTSPSTNVNGSKREQILKLTCVIQRLEGKRNSLSFAKLKENSMGCHGNGKKDVPTVTRMSLRRRHSSPQIERLHEQELRPPSQKQRVFRTVSCPARADLTQVDPSSRAPNGLDVLSSDTQTQQEDAYSCDSDSEQYVDSPDSGFASESSCSVPSPGGDPINGFFYSPSKSADNKQEVDCEAAKELVRWTSSTDSGIQVSCDTPSSEHSGEPRADKSQKEEEEGLRLVLCQESVREAQRLKEEAKKREEDASLQEKYQCLWKDCPAPFENRSVGDLHQHLQEFHVEKKKAEKYCCLWKGCKWYEKYSRKLAWIQRHVGEHSGEKPYKCILDGCDASFSSLCSRKRHVEAHYSEVSLPKARVGGEHGNYPRFLLNSRRVQNKRKTLANRHDCIDNRTLGFIRGAITRNEVTTATDTTGNSSDVVFTAQVMGRRDEEDGTKSVLVRWQPPDMLPDQWLPEDSLKKKKVVNRCMLPRTAKTSLKKLYFFGRKPLGRKPTKQSLLGSLFGV